MKKLILIVFTLIAGIAHANPPELDPAKLMAVHLTNFVPKDGLIIAGLGGSKVLDPFTKKVIVSGEDNLKMQAKLPWRRITLHWSLGAPLECVDLPESRVDWSARKYAVLEPLEKLLDTSLGGRFNDWHTFGPHRLSEKAVIFVPKAESDLVSGIKTISYDPLTQNVSQAVLAYLKGQQLPILKLDFATSPELTITQYNYKNIVAQISTLSKEVKKSWIIQKVYDQYLDMGADALEAYLQSQTNQDACIKMTDGACIGRQKVFVDGAETTVLQFLGPVTLRHPKIHFGFTNHFVFANIKEKLTKVFDRTIQFRAAEAIPHSREKYGCAWHEQLEPEDSSTLTAQRQAIKDAELLFKKVPDQLPKACQKAGRLWVLGLKLWIRDVAKHRMALLEKGTPFYSQSDDNIVKHLDKVIFTVNKHSVKPLLKLFKRDLAKEYGFDFLTQKYPELVEAAERPFEDHEAVTLDDPFGDIKKNLGESIYHDDGEMMDFGASVAEVNTLMHKNATKELERGHPRNGFYKAFFDRRKVDINCFEDVLLGAEYLYQKIADEKHERSLVIFPGRSGYLHQMAYEEVLKQMNDTNQRAVHVAFSGIPDAETRRVKDSDQADQLRSRIENIVTSDKLNHYFSYLDQKKLTSYSHIYIVDLVSSGSGMNGFVKVLDGYFASRHKETPPLRAMILSGMISFDKAPQSSPLFAYRREGNYSENKWFLSFYGECESNIKAYKIPASVILYGCHTHFKLIDGQKYRHYFGLGMKYPAQAWTPENDARRDAVTDTRKALEKYFRHNAAKQIAWHMKKYGICTVSDR